jgi:hypothetical protein
VLHEGDSNQLFQLTSHAFLIEHEAVGKKVFFDLGYPKVPLAFTFDDNVKIGYFGVSAFCSSPFHKIRSTDAKSKSRGTDP